MWLARRWLDVQCQRFHRRPRAVPGHTGLIARYSGPGDCNMYLGALVNIDGQFSAQIWRNLDGTWTQLASTPVDSGAGLLRFTLDGTLLELFFEGELAASVNDSALATGSVGIRSLGGTADDFVAGDVGAFAELPHIDSFDEDAENLGLEWDQQVNGYRQENGQAVPMDASSLAVATLSGISAVDVSIRADIDVTGEGVCHAGLAARYSGPGDADMYLGALVNLQGTLSAQIWRNVDATWTLLASGPLPSAAGTVRFDVFDTTLELYFEDQLVATAQDDAIREAGTVGLRSLGGSFDNFHIQQYDAPKTLFFKIDNHAFTSQSDSGDLQLATADDVSASDVELTALVDVQAGLHAGLVARYSGPADQNMYLAALVNLDGQYSVQLWRNLDGQWAQLSSQTVASGRGTLSFSVIGSTLSVSLDGQLIDQLTDTTIADSGAVGVRGAGGVFESFSASLSPAAVLVDEVFVQE